MEGREGVRIQELVEWFIEQRLKQLDSEEEAKELSLKIRSIIDMILKKENTLVFYGICIRLL